MAHSHDRTLLASLAFGDPDKKNQLHDLGCQYVARPEVVAALGWTYDYTFQVTPFEGWTRHPSDSKFWFREQEVLGQGQIADRLGSSVTRTLPVRAGTGALFDSMIVKGDGKYASTIGFVDAIVPLFVDYDEAITKKVDGKWRLFETRKAAEGYCKLVESLLNGYYVVSAPLEVPPVTAQDLENTRAALLSVRSRVELEGLSAPAPGGWRVPTYETVSAGRRCREISPLCVEVKIGEVSVGDVLRQINLYRKFHQPAGNWLVAAAFEMSSSFVDTLRSQDITVVHLGENFHKWAADQRAAKPSLPVQSI